MKKLLYAALTYLIIGLVAGVGYREYTKYNDFYIEYRETLGFSALTQLNVLHTHVLALGMLFFLIALALDGVFRFSAHPRFNAFFWTYNAGLLLTATMMVVRGVTTAEGIEVNDAAISGMAGLGHIALSIGLAFFFAALIPAVKKVAAEREAA